MQNDAKLRVELWNNGRKQPELVGSGQNVIYRVIEPDEWSCSWGHPDIGECLCIRHFLSIDQRLEHIKQVRRQYGEYMYELIHEDVE